MGCTSTYLFENAADTDDLIFYIREENLKIDRIIKEDNKLSLEERMPTKKMKFVNDFIDLSEMLVTFIHKKKINNQARFNRLLSNCYSTLFGEYSMVCVENCKILYHYLMRNIMFNKNR